MHAEPSHWLHEISISKTVCHHFWPGLMAGAEIWGQWGPVLGNEFRGMCLKAQIFLLQQASLIGPSQNKF